MRDTFQSLGLLALRVGFGVHMAFHGASKAKLIVNGDFDKFTDPLGLPANLGLFGAVGAELVCAIAVALGIFTRLAALPVVFTMGVAAFVVHGSDPWLMGGGPSKEPALLYGIGFLAIVLLGPGRFSLDAWFKARRGG